MDAEKRKHKLVDSIISAFKKDPQTVTQALFSDTCPEDPYQDLQLFLDGQPEYQYLRDHLRRCESCREIAVELQYTSEIDEKLRDYVKEQLDLQRQQSEQHQYAWAADSFHSGEESSAFGMAVYGDGVTADRIECAAWVSNQIIKQGKLEIWGRQLTTLADGSQSTGPIDYLEEKLEGLFTINEYLQAFHLEQRRIINIDLGSDKILSDADCLSLAIIMAIVKAVCKTKPDPHTVYAASLGLDGELKPIGNIERKIIAARKQGFRTFIMATAQFPNISNNLKKDIPDFQLLCFNDLREVLAHENLLPEQFLEPSGNESNTSVTGLCPSDKLTPDSKQEFEKIPLPPRLQEKCTPDELTFLHDFFDLTTEICLSSRFNETREMLLMVGEENDFKRPLTEACFAISGKNPVLPEDAERLTSWSAILGNTSLVLGITKNGTIDGFYRVAQQLEDSPEISHLLSDRNRRSAILSKITGALVFHFLPSGRSLNMFSEGKLSMRFNNGKWQQTNHEDFLDKLTKCCREHNIDRDAAELVTATAINLAQDGYGGIFAFTDLHKDKLQTLWTESDRHEPDFICRQKAITEISSKELFVMGRQKGAMIIDREGFLVTFDAYFTQTVKTYPGINLRHHHARKFSHTHQTIVIVAGRNGTVSLYNNGDNVFTF